MGTERMMAPNEIGAASPRQPAEEAPREVSSASA
jgi:hypothetical protein